MAKATSDVVLDAMGEYVKANVTAQIACSAQPTTYTEAITTYALADVALTGTDVTLANGDTSGRKGTIAAKSAVTIDASGTATHVALVNATGTALLMVTTCTSLALTAGGGNTVGFPAWDFETLDPT